MSDSNPKPRTDRHSFPNSTAFLDFVLGLKPRLAVFDCDGTLWSGDAGDDFFHWEISQKLVPDDAIRWALPSYAEYRAGRVEEAQMCGEMVTIHAGLPVAEIERMVERFFVQVVEPRIFPDMLQLTLQLGASGCEIWAVSSSNEWLIAAGAGRFGIPRERVIATAVAIENGTATDRLTQIPTGPGKALAIREQIRRQPDVVFGNSMHDAAMLGIARRAFAINPNPDLESLARQNGWILYWPQAAFEVAADLGKR